MTPTPTPHDGCRDETYPMPSFEALLAATLALMTGYAQAAPGARHRDDMARKLSSHLQGLAEHPRTSPPLRAMLANLRTHWQFAADGGPPVARVPAPTPLWHRPPQALQ